jgi:hypothetical protein
MLFFYSFGLCYTGDDANKDIGTPTKMYGGEFAELIQGKGPGSQNYSGGVSML